MGAGDEMAATLGAGVRRAGRGVRRPRHRRAGLRGRRRAGARPDRRGRAASARRPRDVAAGEPGLAVGRRLPLVPRRAGRARRWRGAAQDGADVYELLERARRGAPPGRRRRLVAAGAGGGDGAGVERHARAALVRDDGRARPRAPGAGAAGGQRAGAARRDRGDRRRRPRAVARWSASAAGRRGGCCASCAPTSPGCRCAVPDDVETTARGAAMLAAAGAGLHPSVAAAAQAMAGPRGEPVQPDPELREVYDALHRQAPRAVRGAAAAVQASARRQSLDDAVDRRALDRRRRGGGRSRPRRARATSTCSSSAAGSPARARRSTPPRAGCGSGSSRRATSRPGPRARRASSSTAGCATSRWATSGSCARRCASASCCSRGLAPHLVEPVPFLWPLHGRGWERAYLGAGLAALRHDRRRALGAAPPAPEQARARWRRRRRCGRTRSSAPCSSTTRWRTTRAWSPWSRGPPPPTARTSPPACG